MSPNNFFFSISLEFSFFNHFRCLNFSLRQNLKDPLTIMVSLIKQDRLKFLAWILDFKWHLQPKWPIRRWQRWCRSLQHWFEFEMADNQNDFSMALSFPMHPFTVCPVGPSHQNNKSWRPPNWVWYSQKANKDIIMSLWGRKFGGVIRHFLTLLKAAKHKVSEIN